jgi:hypothetical protein
MFKAMINVVMHQSSFGVTDGAFDGLELLGDFQAVSLSFKHGDNTFEMAICSFESIDDVGV